MAEVIHVRHKLGKVDDVLAINHGGAIQSSDAEVGHRLADKKTVLS